MPAFVVDLETSTGIKYGSGPIARAASWRRVRRLSRAGTVAVVAPATDERVSLVQSRRYMHCYAPLTTTTLDDAGYGIIDQIDIDTEARMLSARGDDLLAELRMRSVSFLALKDTGEVPITLVAALDAILAYCNSQADPDWTLDTTTYASVGDTNSNTSITNVTNIATWVGREGSPIFGAGIPANATVTAVGASSLTISAAATATATGVALSRHRVFYVFAGESILQAFIKVADLTGTQFRLHPTIPRCIQWMYTMQPPSGIRAVMPVDPDGAESNSDICLIAELTYSQETSDLISHLYPWGSGSGRNRLGLANADHPGTPDPDITTRVAPDGYTLDLDNNVLRRDDAETLYGYSIKHQTFNDVSPTVDTGDANYSAALVAARNQLFDVALEYLRTHSYPMISYRLKVTKLDAEVLPGETLHVVYRDFAGQLNEQTGAVTNFRWIEVDEDLLVLEATTDIDSNGVRTPALVVSTIPRWPATDRSVVAQLARRVEQAEAHPQPVAHAATSESVTGGVTITGAQTITGAKTFTGATNITSASAPAIELADASTNTRPTAIAWRHNSSGAVANGFGSTYRVQMEDQTTINQNAAADIYQWIDAANATRKVRWTLQVYDTAARTAIIMEADGTNPKIGFLGSTGQARPAAFTQTFATASRTHAAYTSDPESVAYIGAADGEAKLADLQALRVAYENLRTAYESTAQVLNQLLDDLQGYGLLA